MRNISIVKNVWDVFLKFRKALLAFPSGRSLSAALLNHSAADASLAFVFQPRTMSLPSPCCIHAYCALQPFPVLSLSMFLPLYLSVFLMTCVPITLFIFIDDGPALFKSYILKIQQFFGTSEAQHLRNISIVQITLYASSLFGRWHGVTVIDGVELLFPQLCTWNSFAHHSSRFPCPADILRAL